MDELLQYYIINSELNMSPGKIGTQIAHVATNISDDIADLRYEYGMSHEKVKLYHDWKMFYNQKKIILRGKQKDLEKLVGLGFYFIRDIGLTEVPEGSLTCVSLGVMWKSEAQQYVKRLQLL